MGKALAEKLSHIKCSLILTARRIELLEKIKSDLQNNGAEIQIFQNDVSNRDDVKQCMIKVKTEIKNDIDVAILNAGTGRTINPDNYNSADGEIVYGTNVMGLVYWIEELLPGMKKNRKGIIAGVSSLADNRGYPGSSFYCSSKAAASIMLEGLRVEFIKYGIKVVTIKPGFVATP
ncbi:MAG: SDR family oxidoreductase, partial [Ignavibacteria bacterium]